MTTDVPRVLIVADHASARFGGEAILPLHYFRWLRRRGVDVHMVVHARTRSELLELLPQDQERVHYVRDSALHRGLDKLGSLLPDRLAYFSTGFVLRLSTQLVARRVALALIEQHGLEVVHQPIPVSPSEPSVLSRMGVPVVIGPCNGGMTFPPNLGQGSAGLAPAVTAAARRASQLIHHVLRGKLSATTILVANERSRAALPRCVRGRVQVLVENGVDLGLFAASPPRARPVGALRALFVGRLIELKAVDIVLRALAMTDPAITLDVLGDGPLRAKWSDLARSLGLGDRVSFRGFVAQRDVPRVISESDVLVMPSLHECGGAVVLEAMAVGRPVIATAWGGPLDYLDDEVGILIRPDSYAALVQGFASGLTRLANDPAAAERMGRQARARVERNFGWPEKIDQIIAVYRDALDAYRVQS